MRRDDFEHVIAAAANVTGEDDLVVIGSQAVLALDREIPAAMLRSQEADVYPLSAPALADAIDGALGDGSQFHQAFGYYAHGVGPDTAKAPRGWEQRLVRVPIAPRPASKRRPVAWCLEIHDLVLAKCVAGREKDWEFARAAREAGLVDAGTLRVRIADLPIDAARREHIRLMLSL